MTNFKVVDENDKSYGTFNTLEYAREHAQEIADELKIDMFIEKITVENLECIIPS